MTKTKPIRTLSAPLLQDSRIAEQIQIEEDSTVAGVQRYWDQVRLTCERGEASQLRPMQRLIAYWLPEIVKVTRTQQRNIMRGKLFHDGAQHGPVLLSIKPEIAAAAALAEFMNYIAEHPEGGTMVNVGYTIGRAVVAEINADRLKQISKEWRMQEKVKMQTQGDAYIIPADDGDIWRAMTSQTRRLCPTVINKYGNRTLGENVIRQRRAIVATGIFFIHAFFNTCVIHGEDGVVKPGFVLSKKNVRGTNKKAHWVALHESALEVIEEGHRTREAVRPRYLPMIVEPYPWQPGKSGTLRDGIQGGYVSIRTPLVSRPHAIQKEQYLNTPIDRLLGGLNKVSKTAWNINPAIHKVVEAIWKQGGDQLEIPPSQGEPKPEVPADYDTNPEAAEAYRKVAREWYDRQVEQRSLRTTFTRRLAVCDQFTDRAIYFPHLIDFRIRAYPIPAQLNHQGPDLCRGLLEFHKPVELGLDGFQWLCVHAANCYGIDKVTFKDRLDWVDGHMTESVRCAKDPLDTDFWRKADGGEKPWQFLAACMALVYPERGIRIPVQMDGTCNGIQHYAAMMLDEETAAMVNMNGNTTPSDLYSIVAKGVRQRVLANPDISQYADLITRALVKPPVMTSTYGVTLVGMRQQIKDHLYERSDLDKDTIFKLSRSLSQVVQETMRSLCTRVWAAMDYLRDLVDLVTAAGHSMQFTSPMGFPVVQPYTMAVKERVLHSGKRFVINTSGTAKQPPRRGKQRSSFAPNFIHSHDASHMYMTALACPFDFAAAHDCFSAHAGNTTTMRRTTIDTLIELYSVNRLDLLRKETQQRYGIKIPPPPERGNYDLSQLKQSEYAFH
jgi:DNA-directed RNA polymerase